MRHYWKYFTWLTVFFGVTTLAAQGIDKDLLAIQHRMDSVAYFKANLTMTVDISFIKMPVKNAVITYQKGKRMQISTQDFALLPKRGLDFSLNSLTDYPFLTVDRGKESKGGHWCKVLNVIPTDARADFSIATVWLDMALRRLQASEINTKKEGTYQVLLQYEKTQDLLP
ncbi:MAG: hypothetical protein EAZ62_03470, partial [Sphingobacteriia bacterium]